MITATEALVRLKEGNSRFVSDRSDEETPRHGHLAIDQQVPFAIILACSDSRVPTELIFDQGVGDLFVIRVAGNIVAPSQIGSIEYAAEQFGTKLVVVLGHSNCGAVTATLNELMLKDSPRSPNLRAIVDRIQPAVQSLVTAGDSDSPDDFLPAAIRANVEASVSRLQHGSIIIEDLVDSGNLTIVGAEYSLESGRVDFIDGE